MHYTVTYFNPNRSNEANQVTSIIEDVLKLFIATLLDQGYIIVSID